MEMVGPSMEKIIQRQRYNQQVVQGSDQHGKRGSQLPTPDRGNSSSVGGSKGKEKGITVREPTPSHMFLFIRTFLEKFPNQNVMLASQKRLLLPLNFVLSQQQRLQLLLPLLKI